MLHLPAAGAGASRCSEDEWAAGSSPRGPSSRHRDAGWGISGKQEQGCRDKLGWSPDTAGGAAAESRGATAVSLERDLGEISRRIPRDPMAPRECGGTDLAGEGFPSLLLVSKPCQLHLELEFLRRNHGVSPGLLGWFILEISLSSALPIPPIPPSPPPSCHPGISKPVPEGSRQRGGAGMGLGMGLALCWLSWLSWGLFVCLLQMVFLWLQLEPCPELQGVFLGNQRTFLL